MIIYNFLKQLLAEEILTQNLEVEITVGSYVPIILRRMSYVP